MRRDIWVVLGLVLVVASLWAWWRSIEPSFFLVDNNANYFWGSYIHNYRSVVAGEIPLVNYHQLLGNVHLAQGQTGVLYPVLYLAFGVARFVLGSEFWIMDVLALVHWLIAAVGMYGLLREHKCVPVLAFLGGLAWVTYPFVVGVGRNWVVVYYLVAYLPWGYWTLERFLQNKSWNSGVAMIMVRYLLVLQGYVQWVAMVGFVELVYVYVRRGEVLKKWGKVWAFYYAGIWLSVFLLGLPVLWPLWRTADRSIARDNPVEFNEFVHNSVQVGEWLEAQLWRYRDEVLFDGSTYVYHVGLVWLVVLGWLLWSKRKKNKNEYLRAMILMLALVSVCATAVYQVAFFIPGLNWFRWPFKYVVFGEFFLTLILVGLLNERVKKGGREFIAKAIMVLGIVVNVWVITENRDASLAFSPEEIERVPPDVEWRGRVDTSSRVFTYGVDANREKSHLGLGSFNYASVLDINHLGGYDATLATELWRVIQGVPAFGSIQTELSREMVEYLGSWGVGYLVSDERVATEKLLKSHPDLKKVFEGNEVVIENQNARPLVYWQASGEPVKHRWGVNGVTIWPDQGRGDLVVNVFYWPEYRAFGLGRELEVKTKEYRPVIVVPEGINEINFRFVDREFEKGLWLSGATLMAIGLLSVSKIREGLVSKLRYEA